MPTFQRARSKEQREVRRRAILDTTSAMLTEMPVSGVSLNELSRRVGLAKSNVLRYFSSREEILLELLDQAWKTWLQALAADLQGTSESVPMAERCERLTAVVARSLGERRILCDLLGAQAAVLEHNVSADVAAHYKRTALGNVDMFADVAVGSVPELGAGAVSFSKAATLVVGAVWVHSGPSSSMLEAYAANPSLAEHRIQFVPALDDLLTTLLVGTLTRTATKP